MQVMQKSEQGIKKQDTTRKYLDSRESDFVLNKYVTYIHAINIWDSSKMCVMTKA